MAKRFLTPQEAGIQFEKDWAALLGTEPQRGSGSVWTAKLDVSTHTILFSLKHTNADSFRMANDLMQEAEDAINGPGGIGGNAIPSVAISVNQEKYVVLRADDFIALVQSTDLKFVEPTKAEAKRQRAKVPRILIDN